MVLRFDPRMQAIMPSMQTAAVSPAASAMSAPPPAATVSASTSAATPEQTFSTILQAMLSMMAVLLQSFLGAEAGSLANFGTDASSASGGSSSVETKEPEKDGETKSTTPESGSTVKAGADSSAEELRREAIVAKAKEHVGLTKSNPADFKKIVNEISNGADEAWCVHFFCKMLELTGGSDYGHQINVYEISRMAQEKDRYYDFKKDKSVLSRVKPGDGIIYDWTRTDSGYDHIAMVAEVWADGTIVTIGGNESGDKGDSMVDRKIIKPGSDRYNQIIGFIDAV